MGPAVVVDASVAAAAVLDAGPDGLWAEATLSGCHLVAPELMVVEALNILRRLEQADEITALEAASAQQDLHDLPVDLLPIRPFETRIWELRKNVTCYDAWYVAIAEVLDLPLATLDRRLAHSTGPHCQMLTPTP